MDGGVDRALYQQGDGIDVVFDFDRGSDRLLIDQHLSMTQSFETLNVRDNDYYGQTYSGLRFDDGHGGVVFVVGQDAPLSDVGDMTVGGVVYDIWV